MNKIYELHCGKEKITLTLKEGYGITDTLMEDFGWLLKPIIEKTKSLDNALDKLNWKIVTKN
jgi:hypothetical protein